VKGERGACGEAGVGSDGGGAVGKVLVAGLAAEGKGIGVDRKGAHAKHLQRELADGVDAAGGECLDDGESHGRACGKAVACRQSDGLAKRGMDGLAVDEAPGIDAGGESDGQGGVGREVRAASSAYGSNGAGLGG
jgi:hypothetical protein